MDKPMHVRVYNHRTLTSLACEYRLPVTRLCVLAIILLVLQGTAGFVKNLWFAIFEEEL